jgi:hypothetical protein
MRQESILDWTRKQPFEPFVIQLTDGERFVIRHPDMVLPLRGEVVLARSRENDPTRGDRAVMISYFHIVKIERLEGVTPPSSAAKNGSGG